MAKVRVEWVRLSRPDFSRGEAANDLAAHYGAQTLSVSSSAVQTGVAPAFTNPDGSPAPGGFARVSGLAGAVNLAWGSSAIPSETMGVRLEAGASLLIAVASGDSLSFIEAADSPAAQDVQTHPLQADATSRSGVITTGGTAQDLMPANPARRGWRLQNQSAGDLYVRSKGSGGTTAATQDQNSFLIPAGAGWTEDGHVTPNALSVVGAATGQAFYAREW